MDDVVCARARKVTGIRHARVLVESAMHAAKRRRDNVLSILNIAPSCVVVATANRPAGTYSLFFNKGAHGKSYTARYGLTYAMERVGGAQDTDPPVRAMRVTETTTGLNVWPAVAANAVVCTAGGVRVTHTYYMGGVSAAMRGVPMVTQDAYLYISATCVPAHPQATPPPLPPPAPPPKHTHTIRGRLREVLNCNMCMEMCRTPLLLPCSHIFCRECMQAYMAGAPLVGVSCPECYSHIPTGAGDVERMEKAARVIGRMCVVLQDTSCAP